MQPSSLFRKISHPCGLTTLGQAAASRFNERPQ
jgi:hypothetical protein